VCASSEVLLGRDYEDTKRLNKNKGTKQARNKKLKAAWRLSPYFKIAHWNAQFGGNPELPHKAAENLIRHFADTKGWTPEYTASQSPIDLAALLTDERKAAADKKTDNQEKREAPRDVNDCARYIRQQKALIKQGKRLSVSKKELIREHLGHNKTGGMERQLTRYKWLLEIGQ
jgi:hypothetical protein